MGEFCNTINNKWHSRCWMGSMPNYLLDFGITIGCFFDVVRILFTIEFFIVFLHFSGFKHTSLLISKMNDFHHLIIIPMCAIVGVYLVFKQKRPCFSIKDNQQIGTLYGMPSGDALFSSLVACCSWKTNNIFSVLLVLCVCFSRVTRGYHSILQTIMGSLIGILIFYIRIISGDCFIYFNWVFTFLLPLLVLFDRDLKEQRGTGSNNLYTWLVQDYLALFFDILICGPDSLWIGKYSIVIRSICTFSFHLTLLYFGNLVSHFSWVLSLV